MQLLFSHTLLSNFVTVFPPHTSMLFLVPARGKSNRLFVLSQKCSETNHKVKALIQTDCTICGLNCTICWLVNSKFR